MNTTIQDCLDYSGCYPSREYLEKNVVIIGKEIEQSIKQLHKQIEADIKKLRRKYKDLHKNTNKLTQNSDNEEYKNKFGSPLRKVDKAIAKLNSHFNGWH